MRKRRQIDLLPDAFARLFDIDEGNHANKLE
jgi:hypothetical protein